MRLVRVVVLLALLGALAFALYADSASAMTTWSGTCKYEGWSQFWPKRRWIPAPSGYHYQGTGTCKGTLNGQPYDLHGANRHQAHPLGACKTVEQAATRR